MKEGKWIYFPGDFEIALAEKVQAKRVQRDFPIRPFWRVDSPWHNVRFFAEIHLDEPTTFHFSWEGDITVFFRRPKLSVDDVYSYDFTGEMDVPAGDHWFEVWVYNPTGLPCLKIDSDSFITDENMLVSFNQIDLVPAAVCKCGNLTPNTYCLPTREIKPVRTFEWNGDTIYDFGKLILAYAKVTGEGNYRLYFGETLSEATNDVSKVKLLAELPYFGNKTKEQAFECFCEQRSAFTLKAGETGGNDITKAFRYLRVNGAKHTLQVEEEYDPTPTVATYHCPSERNNKIFEVAKYTFSMCAREFYLDGAKRDRWLWGGDAYEAEKAEYYYQYDVDRIKRSIIALFGKKPIVRYINHIMDYTLYTIISVWEYYEHTGDKDFVRYIEPMVTESIEYCLKRLSKDGFLVNQKYRGKFVDWLFIDWVDLPDTNGEVSFEQVLFWAALTKTAKIYDLLGKDNSHYVEIAKNLKEKINEVFWDEERGMYVFARNDGALDTSVSCHVNVMAMLYGFVEGSKRERIIDALVNDKFELSITPFMVEFVLMSLFEAGAWQKGKQLLEDFWGGMVDVGATTFWEKYTQGEENESATDMYGRPFGRSKCHIWGAGPLYVIPRYYFGIRFDLNCGENFSIDPNLELIRNSSLTVPCKRGTLTVEHDGKGIRVFATDLGGTLTLNGKTYDVLKGKELYVEE